MVNTEEFDKYFKAADLDHNGRISISEAISFFQKFGLPNSDLAKIWKYVDQDERGFLERTEFYNALKLVTLAQKGHSITPEIVISELYGPNGPTIPPPVIPSPSSQIGSNFESDWPRISKKDIAIYTEIFQKIDKDNDGLISSDQASTCFLSWKLPIEVINQVIDLSDLDKDGIFSMREFCTAVYLLARYKEGHIIPNFLPNSLLFDEKLVQATGLPSSFYINPKLKSNSGLQDWAHEHSRQNAIHFQTRNVDLPIKPPNYERFNSFPKEKHEPILQLKFKYNIQPNNMGPTTPTPSSSEIKYHATQMATPPLDTPDPEIIRAIYASLKSFHIDQHPSSSGLRGLADYESTSSNRDQRRVPEEPTPTCNFNPNYDYNNTGPIHYPSVPTAPVEPFFTGQIRYPSIDLTHVDLAILETEKEPSKENVSKEAGTGTSTGTRDSGGTGTGEEEENNRECIVCYERPKNCACIPCGHVATCYECLEIVKNSQGGFCPICRGEIEKIVKIYTV